MRCPECGQKDCCGASLAPELDDHDRWLKEMVDDYRLEADDNTISRRLAINRMIHDLRAERAALRKHAEALVKALDNIGVTTDEDDVLWTANHAINNFRAVYPKEAEG